MRWLVEAVLNEIYANFHGIIVIWSGWEEEIPEGWHLCNGENGTVDLRSQFVIGAGLAYDPHDTGGAGSHSHQFTSDDHTHRLASGSDFGAGTGFSQFTGPEPVEGNTNPQTHLPPFYALCYIQKV